MIAPTVASDAFRELERELRQRVRFPVATYRLQLSRDFTFRDAAALAPYLRELGVTECYASPYLKARPDSTHGYDITDHNALNPAIGSPEDYAAFVAALQAADLGQILDVVPNHVGIGPDNPWWQDVLESGESSPYASFFDIDWTPLKPQLAHKVLLPVLGGQYGQVLERQELALDYADGGFFVRYYDHRFPVSPVSAAEVLRAVLERLARRVRGDARLRELSGIVAALSQLPGGRELDAEGAARLQREKGAARRRLARLGEAWPVLQVAIEVELAAYNGDRADPRSFDRLDALLEAQAYRLSYWRVAAEQINYRRFFDVNDLAALRMGHARVFDETHRLILRLLGEGAVTGLRVDHPDGLWNPGEYFARLQRAHGLQLFRSLLAARGDLAPDAWPDLEPRLIAWLDEEAARNPEALVVKPLPLVVEKILGRAEGLREDWPVWGTTGYEFANALNGLLVDQSSEPQLDSIYTRFIGRRLVFEDVAYESKRLIMRDALASEINVLAHMLADLCEQDRRHRDFTLNGLTDAIREVIACFPVYRTYIVGGQPVDDHDRQRVETAVARAKRRNPGVDSSIYDFVRDALLVQPADAGTAGEAAKDHLERAEFAMKLQQVTGPVVAKGVEDTAFYIYNRLVSLNEVGGQPDQLGSSVAAFHRQNAERRRRWPYSLLATTTHDTKRSEDVRARIDVLSELPREWRAALGRWSRLNARRKTLVEGVAAPDRNEEYLLYQTLLGIWPLEDLARVDDDAYGDLQRRVETYMLKAIREAKVNTSWIRPNGPHEEAVGAFVRAILDRSRRNQFLGDFQGLAHKVAEHGMLNSLAQTLLKICSPGVPDFYQGTELWDFSLVDPDNRRPVDYARRRAMLRALRERGADDPAPLDLAQELVASRRDGRVKLYLTHRALHYRLAQRELFAAGSYLPLEATGHRADHVCAFARRFVDQVAVVVVPRLTTKLARAAGELPLGPEPWRDTWLALPEEVAGPAYRNVLTGEVVLQQQPDGSALLPAHALFASFPVALLERLAG